MNTKQILTHHNSIQQEPWQQIYEFCNSSHSLLTSTDLEPLYEMLEENREEAEINAALVYQWNYFILKG